MTDASSGKTPAQHQPTTPRLTSLAHGGGCGCKIAPGLLSELLTGLSSMTPHANLLVGTETSDDAAVYRLNDSQALIATTDFFMPIVDNPYDFGRIAATNALSDVYAMGGSPIFALAIVGMPINVLPAEVIREILRGGQDTCQLAGIPIAGGHSIDSVEPIYGLAAMGLAHPDHIRRNDGAQPDDVLILGKPVGVGIYSAALKKSELDTAGYAAMLASTTALNLAGPRLAQMPGVHAMTDVTGFGVLGHAHEMARAANVDIEIHADQVPLLPNVIDMVRAGFVTGASARNWNAYGAHMTGTRLEDPIWRAILSDPQTAGGLLVACAADQVANVLACFNTHANAAKVIGRVSEGTGRVRVD
jgi:selenide, water dikinase